MKRLWEAHPLLVACSVISLVLLVGFSALQMHGSPILALNSQWVLVAGVPLMVALVAGGYIQKFKGFGLELESKLQAPVISLPLKVADAITYMPGSDKETISQLDSMSHNKIRSTKRLSFVIGKSISMVLMPLSGTLVL